VARTAVFLNDTSSSYHWGCFATSSVLKNAVSGWGYDVVSLDVETTHAGFGVPADVACPEAFAAQLPAANPTLHRALQECAIVVINGEGTIHRTHRGPRSLLAMVWACASVYGKPIHVLNHSLFPSGTTQPADADTEAYYRRCLSRLTRAVVRDRWSVASYRRLGVIAHEGFDCLPLYPVQATTRPRLIVLGAASHWSQAEAARLGRLLRRSGLDRSRFVFLSGGPKEPPEDAAHYDGLRSEIPGLAILRAESVGDWVNALASADLLVTGRYHHLVAAASHGTPFAAFAGNTDKNAALCDLIGATPPIITTSDTEETAFRFHMCAPSLSRELLHRAAVNLLPA
jgi:hypothetical protein